MTSSTRLFLQLSNNDMQTLLSAVDLEEDSSECQLLAFGDWSLPEIAATAKYKEQTVLFEHDLFGPESGVICGKTIALSNSSVLRHPFYNYPAVKDPGIIKALLGPEPRIIYPEDGQEQYLAMCEDMDQCPVSMFYKGLLKEVIDLKYYCVNSTGVHVMAKALERNRNVKVLDLTESFLSVDACYHLGEMLAENATLEKLILERCRIESQGAQKLFQCLNKNKTLRVFNLNRNEIGDRGVEFLAEKIFYGIYVKEIYLSKNRLAKSALLALTNSFETYNNLSHIDLSYNNLNVPILCKLLEQLSENIFLEHLNLACNQLSGERIAVSLGDVVMAKNLNYLNLCHNQFTDESIILIIANLGKAKKLRTLDLSYNPLTMKDAVTVVSKMKLSAVKIQQLLLDGVKVNEEFIIIKNKVMKKKKDLIITHGDINTVFKSIGVNVRELVLKRVDFLLTYNKKNKVDFALIILEMLEDGIEISDITRLPLILKEKGAVLDESLLLEVAEAFPGPPTKRKDQKKINIVAIGDYVQRLWPDRKLPPKPPPASNSPPIPEVVPEPVAPKKKK